MTRLILVNIGFSMQKVKTLNFSGSFVACDLKIDRYRHVELMKCNAYLKSRSFLDFGQRPFTNKL